MLFYILYNNGSTKFEIKEIEENLYKKLVYNSIHKRSIYEIPKKNIQKIFKNVNFDENDDLEMPIKLIVMAAIIAAIVAARKIVMATAITVFIIMSKKIKILMISTGTKYIHRPTHTIIIKAKRNMNLQT